MFSFRVVYICNNVCCIDTIQCTDGNIWMHRTGTGLSQAQFSAFDDASVLVHSGTVGDIQQSASKDDVELYNDAWCRGCDGSVSALTLSNSLVSENVVGPA